jgi:putative transcriptional regulator
MASLTGIRLIAGVVDRLLTVRTPSVEQRTYGSFQPARQHGMSKKNPIAAKLTRDGTPPAQILPGGTPRPLPEEMAKAQRVPRVKTLRRALGLTQEEFAARYHIPLGTLRDWEQGRTEPDQPARAYINVIARDPDWVSRALACGPDDRRTTPKLSEAKPGGGGP